MVEGPVAPGRWEFLFSILPYPGGCELHISGMSDFGFNIGFTDSLQGDSPLENYTDG